MSEQTFEGWVILELMGHRRLGGYLREHELAGAAFLRLDVPGPAGSPVATQFYSASAVYCITPTTEELARAVAVRNQPEPVRQWELPEREPQPLPPPLRGLTRDGEDLETYEEEDDEEGLGRDEYDRIG